MINYLDRNLRLYPKLKNLLDKDLTSSSRFLERMSRQINTQHLTYNQALKTCEIIDEKMRKRAEASED